MLVRARSHLGVAAREDSLSVAENLGQRKNRTRGEREWRISACRLKHHQSAKNQLRLGGRIIHTTRPQRILQEGEIISGIGKS